MTGDAMDVLAFRAALLAMDPDTPPAGWRPLLDATYDLPAWMTLTRTREWLRARTTDTAYAAGLWQEVDLELARACGRADPDYAITVVPTAWRAEVRTRRGLTCHYTAPDGSRRRLDQGGFTTERHAYEWAEQFRAAETGGDSDGPRPDAE